MLTPSQTGRIDVILVSPRNPLNIGAAARAMANFGFRRLSIVAPFAMNWMEAKSAVGAPDLLREAKVYETLAEAIAPATLVLGTGSLDKRKPVQTILALPQAATQIRAALGVTRNAALEATRNLDRMKGTGFSPYINAPKETGASAPEGSDPIHIPGAPGLDSECSVA